MSEDNKISHVSMLFYKRTDDARKKDDKTITKQDKTIPGKKSQHKTRHHKTRQHQKTQDKPR